MGNGGSKSTSGDVMPWRTFRCKNKHCSLGPRGSPNKTSRGNPHLLAVATVLVGVIKCRRCGKFSEFRGEDGDGSIIPKEELHKYKTFTEVRDGGGSRCRL